MPISKRYLFTSESVTEGHPDKVADQISDAVLDAILAEDANGRVACETMVSTGMVMVSGEITTKTYVDIPGIVRKTVERIGYNDATYGFDSRHCAVLSSIGRQSADIAMGVDETGGREQGAGDQGMMFGYATRETRERMPLPIILAHRIAERLADVRKGNKGLDQLEWLRPDGKSQVSVEYEGDRPVAVRTVVVSTQHAERHAGRQLAHSTIRQAMIEHVIRPVLEKAGFGEGRTKFLVNPTGRFVIGGPHGDAGLTGRKIIVDTYGGMARHGGGAFSGKDPSKVDRSAAYAVALGRQEHRRGRAGAAVRGAGGLRDRRGRAGLHHGGHLRHRRTAGRAPRTDRRAGVRPDAAGHHHRAQAQAPDLRADGGLRPLRTQAGDGQGLWPVARLLHLGADQPGPRAAQRGAVMSG